MLGEVRCGIWRRALGNAPDAVLTGKVFWGCEGRCLHSAKHTLQTRCRGNLLMLLHSKKGCYLNKPPSFSASPNFSSKSSLEFQAVCLRGFGSQVTWFSPGMHFYKGCGYSWVKCSTINQPFHCVYVLVTFWALACLNRREQCAYKWVHEYSTYVHASTQAWAKQLFS